MPIARPMGEKNTTTRSAVRRVVAAALAIGTAAVALTIAAPPTARAAECAGADAVPAADNLDVVAQATVCLLNEERATYGLPALRRTPVLDRASAAYSQRMVSEAFFAHVGPDGSNIVQRLLAAGYGNRLGRDWIIGENIAWGQDVKATPRATVANWMASDGHRRNILDDKYAEVGIGVALGAPVDPHWGATYTTDFGVLRDDPSSCPQPRAVTGMRGSVASYARARDADLLCETPRPAPTTPILPCRAFARTPCSTPTRLTTPARPATASVTG
jgi:uncharacterized protein YkwD